MQKKNYLGDAATRQARLLEVLQATPDDTTCETCLKKLQNYIAAQLAGEDYLKEYSEVALHLDGCLACAEAYALVYDLAVATAADQLLQPATIPQPDLRFLETTAPQQNLVDLLRQAWQKTGSGYLLQFSAELRASLKPPQLKLTPATRSGDEEARYNEVLFNLTVIPPDFVLPLKLVVYKDNVQAETCLIEVTVTPAGKSWPDLGGNLILLQIGEMQREATTDSGGLVSFDNVPLAGLREMVLRVNLDG